MRLNLLILRSAIPEELAAFYTTLGLSFLYHRHGTGPNHYSAEMDDFVLEIYPLSKSQTRPDPFVRLGFSVANLDNLFKKVPQERILHAPKKSEWGYRCVIKDPEDRRIELTEAPEQTS
jgi:predicted enzyme related to lactoylglutathione lyase